MNIPNSKYYKIMAESASHTSKSKIPLFVAEHMAGKDVSQYMILDVGCADGSFTRYMRDNLPSGCNIVGIDRYFDLIAPRSPDREDGIMFLTESFDESFCNSGIQPPLGYDCIVFSSVMHEISSFCGDSRSRYGKMPIQKALQMAASLLKPGGIIIVRDMVAPNRCKTRTRHVEFDSIRTIGRFLEFVRYCPHLRSPYNLDGLSEFVMYNTNEGLVLSVREDVLLEFLMAYTWGDDRFSDEMRERKFILTKSQWSSAISKAGLEMVSYFATNEEYPLYFGKFCKVWGSKWKYPATTCTIIARKPTYA